MSPVEEIRSAFANLPVGTIAALKAFPAAWAFRTEHSVGVAVEAEQAVISERFAGALLHTTESSIDGRIRRVIRLESTRVRQRNEFAVLCGQFLDPSIRGQLQNDPAWWWRQWRELLGNAAREKAAYAALGELIVLERLLHRGLSPTWMGPTANSHDIETSGASYEVKSTVSRYDSTVNIAGQYQLQPVEDRDLFLVHLRFEPTPAGETLDGLYGRLTALGMDGVELDELLRSLGHPRGAVSRSQSFVLLDAREFSVDEHFPRILPTSFVGGRLPTGIVAVEYRIDLSGLASRAFDEATQPAND